MGLPSGCGPMGGRGRRARRVLVAATMAALLSGSTPGCSLMFVRPPPGPEDLTPIVRCTSSDALPVVDVLVGMLQVMRTLVAFSATDADYAHAAIPREGDIIIGVGLSALFLTSSVVGFRETHQCRDLRGKSIESDPRPWVRNSLPRSTVRPPSRAQRKL